MSVQVNSIYCDKCSSTFKNSELLNQHTRNRHVKDSKEFPIKCPSSSCEERKGRVMQILEHIELKCVKPHKLNNGKMRNVRNFDLSACEEHRRIAALYSNFFDDEFKLKRDFNDPSQVNALRELHTLWNVDKIEKMVIENHSLIGDFDLNFPAE